MENVKHMLSELDKVSTDFYVRFGAVIGLGTAGYLEVFQNIALTFFLGLFGALGAASSKIVIHHITKRFAKKDEGSGNVQDPPKT